MACGSGCCKPAAPPPSPPGETSAPGPASGPVEQQQQGAGPSEVDDDDCCQDSCCGAAPAELVKCGDSGSGCCTSSALGDEHGGGDSGCKTTTSDNHPALSKETLDTAEQAGCKDDGCCAASSSSDKTVVIDADTNVDANESPPCCKGKASPCCDTSCLDRLARRSCDRDLSQCDARNNKYDDEPCSEHRRTVRERFQAISCICRALMSLGQESCCIPPVERSPSSIASTSTSRRGPKKSRASLDSSISLDSCCRAPAATSLGTTCGGKSVVKKKRSADSCCGQPKTANPPSAVDSCSGESCCAGRKEAAAGPSLTKAVVAAAIVAVADPEKGLSGSEHVVLGISGMTCTGCETKLSRTLAAVPGISNLKTSLVLSRAEFDLNLAANSVTMITKHLERTTEFTCERIMNQGLTIDVVPPSSCEDFLRRDPPVGVTEMTLVGKDTVRIAFDAKIIGARDLCTHGFGKETPLKLAPPRADPALEAGSRHVRSLLYMTIFSAILTVPVLVLAWAPLPPQHEIAYASASLALATIIQVVVAGPFYPTSLKSLIFSRVVEMDFLIVLSTTTAYVFSVVSFGYLVAAKPLPTGQFFETSTLLVTLIMVGRYFAALARQKAVESISVRSLQTTEAILVSDDGQESIINTGLLQYGDRFKVMPDSRVPTDGTVISGISEVNESMITGESRPVEKGVKSSVIAGSINGSGTLVVRLTRLPGENTISIIASMVDEAKLSKPKIQDLADRVASYFVPGVLLLTLITFVAWVCSGVRIYKMSSSEAVINAITFAISVLVVSCPCAIGLAVPLVIVVATGVAADRGVIFKTAESMEVAHKTSHVVFDKTGTLTEGKLAVRTETWVVAKGAGAATRQQHQQQRDNALAGLLLGLVSSNKHPVSAAVAAHLKDQQQRIAPAEVRDPKAMPGKGVEGTCATDGRILRAGHSRWLKLCTESEPEVAAVLEKGHTAFCFTVDGALAAVFGLQDSCLRPDARETVAELQSRGIQVSLLSGDDDGAVRDVAVRLGIEEANVRSKCTPADKRAYVQALLEPSSTTSTSNFPLTSLFPYLRGLFNRRRPNTTNNKSPVIMFCGDGTNDAAALAQATIGVHISGHQVGEGEMTGTGTGTGTGTDVAQAAADVVLVRPRLGGVLTAVDASAAAARRVAFNFGWSFVYNVFAVLLAAGAFGGYGGIRIPPEFAGLGELVSVVPVVGAAVALRWVKI